MPVGLTRPKVWKPFRGPQIQRGRLDERDLPDSQSVGLHRRRRRGETDTSIFASRSTGPAQARIFCCKNAVPLAALPAIRTGHVLEIVCEAYPQFIPAPDVLHTSLDNMGAISHPALVLLNAGWIERTKGDFQFYIDGVTRHRPRVGGAGSRTGDHRGCAGSAGPVGLEMAEGCLLGRGEDAVRSDPGYQGIKAPRNLRHRYIFEDVPFSLVPMASLGAEFGVAMWAIGAMIRLACVIHGTNYYERGRTVEDMGLKGLRAGEMTRYVQEGRSNPISVDKKFWQNVVAKLWFFDLNVRHLNRAGFERPNA